MSQVLTVHHFNATFRPYWVETLLITPEEDLSANCMLFCWLLAIATYVAALVASLFQSP